MEDFWVVEAIGIAYISSYKIGKQLYSVLTMGIILLSFREDLREDFQHSLTDKTNTWAFIVTIVIASDRRERGNLILHLEIASSSREARDSSQ